MKVLRYVMRESDCIWLQSWLLYGCPCSFFSAEGVMYCLWTHRVLSSVFNVMATSHCGPYLAEWLSFCQTQRWKMASSPLCLNTSAITVRLRIPPLYKSGHATPWSPQRLPIAPGIQLSSVLLNLVTHDNLLGRLKTPQHLEPSPDHVNQNLWWWGQGTSKFKFSPGDSNRHNQCWDWLSHITSTSECLRITWTTC